jgi:protein-tyrosine kinase
MERLQKALDRARRERESKLPADVAVSVNGMATAPTAEPLVLKHTAVVPVEASVLRANRVMPADASGPTGHGFKMLRTQVLQRMQQHGWSTLAVFSAAPDDGKTFVAINLAIAIAGDPNHTALLVDFDFHNPSVHQRFGFQPQAGVEQCLRGKLPVADVLVTPQGYRKLLLLPGLAAVSDSSELLTSEPARKLTREMKTRYPDRVVLFDLPPLLGHDDALAFAPQVDAALVVVAEEHTRREDLQRSLEMVRGVPIVGTVLNRSRTDSARSYAY